MPESEIDAMVAYVDDLLKATSEGKIEWTSVNATTFSWNRTTPPSRWCARSTTKRSFQPSACSVQPHANTH